MRRNTSSSLPQFRGPCVLRCEICSGQPAAARPRSTRRSRRAADRPRCACASRTAAGPRRAARIARRARRVTRTRPACTRARTTRRTRRSRSRRAPSRSCAAARPASPADRPRRRRCRERCRARSSTRRSPSSATCRSRQRATAYDRVAAVLLAGPSRREARAAVLADDDRRDALANHRLRARVGEQRPVAVRVDVDEAGRDREPARVDLDRRLCRAMRRATAAMRPPAIATSISAAAAPVPSMTLPPRITRSCAARFARMIEGAPTRPATVPAAPVRKSRREVRGGSRWKRMRTLRARRTSRRA